jgi:hypothetical protein
MADESYRRVYFQPSDFPLLVGSIAANIDLLETALVALALTVPISDVRLAAGGTAALVEWLTLPVASDIAAVDAVVAAFTGGTTTSQPFEYNSFATSTSTSSTPVVKIDETTPPLDAGTYQVIWTSSTRMQAVIPNTGVQADITLTRSDGVFVHQDDAWDLANRHAFNGAITFQVLAGQTIRSQLTFNRLGASGTAEMSGARITVDKLS